MKTDTSVKENQIGCGYCAHEKQITNERERFEREWYQNMNEANL